MKTKPKDLRKISVEGLLEMKKKLKIALQRSYIRTRGGTPLGKGEPSAKDIKKEIARINTILKENE